MITFLYVLEGDCYLWSRWKRKVVLRKKKAKTLSWGESLVWWRCNKIWIIRIIQTSPSKFSSEKFAKDSDFGELFFDFFFFYEWCLIYIQIVTDFFWGGKRTEKWEKFEKIVNLVDRISTTESFSQPIDLRS